MSFKKVAIKFEKLSANAVVPQKQSKNAAGFDLYAAEDAVVKKRANQLIKTDLKIQMPCGTYGRIASRSGLSLRHSIEVGAGVIDGDYRGNVGVLLYNHSDQDFNVVKGDRIAQLIPERIAAARFVEIQVNETERGDSGFGSRGIN